MTASAYPQVSRFLLQSAFKFYPPPCTTYLLTDEHPSVDDQNPDMKIFEPERETLKLARLEADLQDEVAAHTDSEGHVHLQHDAAESAWVYTLLHLSSSKACCFPMLVTGEMFSDFAVYWFNCFFKLEDATKPMFELRFAKG